MLHSLRPLMIIACAISGLQASPIWWETGMPTRYKDWSQKVEVYPYKYAHFNELLPGSWFPLIDENTFDDQAVVNTVQTYLTQQQIDINYRNPYTEQTIAHFMARCDGRTLNQRSDWRLELLAAAGADFTLADRDGRNCLHLAVLGDAFDNVNFLLSNHRDLADCKDDNGQTPYDLAVLHLGEDSPITQRLGILMFIGEEIEEQPNENDSE